jgi:hypothetical protein
VKVKGIYYSIIGVLESKADRSAATDTFLAIPISTGLNAGATFHDLSILVEAQSEKLLDDTMEQCAAPAVIRKVPPQDEDDFGCSPTIRSSINSVRSRSQHARGQR